MTTAVDKPMKLRFDFSKYYDRPMSCRSSFAEMSTRLDNKKWRLVCPTSVYITPTTCIDIRRFDIYLLFGMIVNLQVQTIIKKPSLYALVLPLCRRALNNTHLPSSLANPFIRHPQIPLMLIYPYPSASCVWPILVSLAHESDNRLPLERTTSSTRSGSLG